MNKYTSKRLLCFTLIIITISFLSSCKSVKTQAEEIIWIDSDEDFVSYGFSGAGTVTNPYKIQNLIIEDAYFSCIYICGVTKYFIIQNCRLQSIQYGIYICNVENNTAKIQDNSIILDDDSPPYSTGIYLENSHHSMIKLNTFSGGSFAIRLFDTYNSTIENNTFLRGNKGSLYCQNSAYTEIINNEFMENGISIEENTIEGYLSYEVIGNTVDGLSLGFKKNLVNQSLIAPNFGQLLLINCSSVQVSNQLIDNTEIGLGMFYCRNSSIRNCDIKRCNNGIYLKSSENIFLHKNNCTITSFGVSLISSHTISVCENFFGCRDTGIQTSDSIFVNISENILDNSPIGVYALRSSYLLIESNNLTSSIIEIHESPNSTIRRNKVLFSNFNNGLVVDKSPNTLICHNSCKGTVIGTIIRFSPYCVVENNTNEINNVGFIIEFSEDSEFINNTCIENHEYGLMVYLCSSLLVKNNIFYRNGKGFLLSNSVGSTLINNSFLEDGLVIGDSQLESYQSYIIAGNIVNSKPLGYFIDTPNLVFESSDYGQLILVNCVNPKIVNQKIRNTTIGLSLVFCTDSRIEENEFSSNSLHGIYNIFSQESLISNNTCTENKDSGIKLIFSDETLIVQNNCEQSDYGIYVAQSIKLSIISNLIKNCYIGIQNNYVVDSEIICNKITESDRGISLDHCTRINVKENICNRNYIGINLRETSESSLFNNTCSFNNNNGIKTFYSHNNWIYYNLLQENKKYGVYLQKSNGNSLHHNTFVDNNLDGNSQAYDDTGNNTWYELETEEGNYWNEWSKRRSYRIDGEAGATDPYPLKNPTHPSITSEAYISFIVFTISIILITNVFSLIKKRRIIQRKENN
ncbi:MAG: NosD domain-containing protein [Candidatus Heimdallarchaeaceae archaeon]